MIVQRQKVGTGGFSIQSGRDTIITTLIPDELEKLINILAEKQNETSNFISEVAVELMADESRFKAKRSYDVYLHKAESGMKAERTNSFSEFASRVLPFLLDNEYVFNECGPHSKTAAENPFSNAYLIWIARKMDTILPNNRAILALIKGIRFEVTADQRAAMLAFEAHARAFEQHQFTRLDHYPTFPGCFSDLIKRNNNIAERVKRYWRNVFSDRLFL